jgi:hypothetical protein
MPLAKPFISIVESPTMKFSSMNLGEDGYTMSPFSGMWNLVKAFLLVLKLKSMSLFGPSVHDAYVKAKAKQIFGISTNAPVRIERLLPMHFSEPDISMFDIRYQLLYATAGTIAASADFSALYVMVLKTAMYSESIGVENYQDYIQFMNKVGAAPIKLPSEDAICHKLELNGNTLICLHEYFEI